MTQRSVLMLFRHSSPNCFIALRLSFLDIEKRNGEGSLLFGAAGGAAPFKTRRG
jgi:hypothetical protein